MALANSTLGRIIIEVRRITRSPGASQITDDQIIDYVNTFYLYDMPSNLRLFNLRNVFKFFTIPNVDIYYSQNTNPNNDLYNFKDQIVAIHNPVFVAGVPAFFTQWRNVFYGNWPITNTTADTMLRGNGTTGPFTGTLTAVPVIQNNVMFSCFDINNEAMNVVDYPIDRNTGTLSLQNQTPPVVSYGTINYLTGAYSITWPNFTLNDVTNNIIWSNTIPYQVGTPISVLYYNDAFIVRPIPDKVYPITVEADIIPSELLLNSDMPELNQWWQYIALGTCLKIFRSRMDMNSYQMLFPEFQMQESMVNSRTLTQQVNMRTETIFTQGKQFYGWWGFGSSGWPY
jgi:hypothetical protein